MAAQSNTIFDIIHGVWRRRKWLIIMTFVSVFAIGASLVASLPSMYAASTTLIFGNDDISEDLVGPSVSGELEQRLDLVSRTILSRTALQDVIETYNLYPEMRKTVSPEGVINRMREDSSITQDTLRRPEWGQDAKFSINIGYQGWSPELTATVTNDLANRFALENESIGVSQLTRTAGFLKQQLAEAEQRYFEEQAKVNEFNRENLGGLPEQEMINLASLNRQNAELRINLDKQTDLEGRRNDLVLGLSNIADPNGAGLTGVRLLDSKKRELSALRARYTESYPNIVRLRTEIEVLEREISLGGLEEAANATPSIAEGYEQRQLAEIENQLRKLRVDQAELEADIEDVLNRIEATPTVGQELGRLNSSYNAAREEYFSLQKRYGDALLAEDMERQRHQNFQVLEEAIAPEFPIAPNGFNLYIMITLLAAACAGALAFLAEFFDSTFHTIEDMRAFTSLPVIVSIAKIDTRADKLKRWLKFGIVTATVAVVIVVFAVLSFNYGQSNGQDLVWMLS